MKLSKKFLLGSAIAAGCVVFGAGDAGASSHREAPFVTRHPKVDSTDFYMFMSPARANYVTIIANYQPFQENFGGPNYYEMDPDALYEILVDNNGDGKEDMTFQFQFHNTLANSGKGLDLSAFTGGGAAAPGSNPVPFINIGPISSTNTGALNVNETYDLTLVAGDRRTGTSTSMFTGQTKPTDYVGTSTFGAPTAYENYAMSYKKDFNMPGCDQPSTAWVGQRRDGFAANIGPIFDLVGNGTIGSVIEGGDSLAGRGLKANKFDTGLLYNKNITSLVLEVPVGCLAPPGSNDTASKGIIGGWTAASLHQARVLNPNANYTVPSKEAGAWVQVSHLGMPLVNEVVIGLPDKDTFSAVSPISTSAVAKYVTNPTLPAILEILYGTVDTRVKAPTMVRTDLVAAFATGLTVPQVDSAKAPFVLTQTSSFTQGGIPAPAAVGTGTFPDGVFEYLRLNTNVPATSNADQLANPARGLGAVACLDGDRKLDLAITGCDPAGFPNGRRPSDDVVDIALRVAMGALIADGTVAPAHDIPFTDANYNGPEQFTDTFPYLRTPLAGNVDPNQNSDDIAQK